MNERERESGGVGARLRGTRVLRDVNLRGSGRRRRFSLSMHADKTTRCVQHVNDRSRDATLET